ncbi:hypothetical protein MalM25_27600 [Planctomycetes bacterium MalM25]|nr:hypothetical protein MalM25_27600 [Planctomycetes bacterium MalM25]
MRCRPALLFFAASALAMTAASAPAQGLLDPGPAGSTAEPRPEYSQSIGKMTPLEIIQAKAQVKAAQRGAVLAARQWYGYSQARPKTSATPFSGLYGQQFQGRAFGRPAAHYATRPIIVISR